MDVPDLAGLGDDVGLHPQALADQMVVDGGHGQQHRQRGIAGVDAAVAQDDQAGARRERPLRPRR